MYKRRKISIQIYFMHQQLLEVFEIFVSLLRILIMNKIYNGEEFYERASDE